MRTIWPILALLLAGLWAAPAFAACASQLICGDDGVCRTIEVCDDDPLDLAGSDPAEMTHMSAGAHDIAANDAAARGAMSEALPANCKLVDICGTWKQVCN